MFAVGKLDGAGPVLHYYHINVPLHRDITVSKTVCTIFAEKTEPKIST